MRYGMVWALAGFLLSGASYAGERPNFVFILVDDLGWADIGANNPGTFYETPNIDRLASTGMRFTQAYAACPVCSPTRASILTGKYPARLGLTDFIGAPGWTRPTPLLPAPNARQMPLEEVTLPEALRDAGYATFFAGKWHLGDEGYGPLEQGFDVNVGGWRAGMPRSFFSPYENPALEDGPVGEHLPDRLARETAAFIESHRDGPFLAYLSFYSVHIPLEGRADLIEKYTEKRRGLPRVPDERRWGREPPRDVRLVQDVPVYAAMVEAMDRAVGVVLDRLDALGLSEHTVVVFFSDNGGVSTSEGFPTSNAPLRAGKGWLYEGGVREPLIIRAPGVTPPGSACDTPVISTDFYPTLLELAGVGPRPEQHADGVSLAGLLRGRPAGADRPLFWHYPHYGNQGGSPGGAVRLGPYKLIEFYEDRRVELYDLTRDIGESRDLSAEMPDKARELRRLLEAWRRTHHAAMPTANPAHDADALARWHERQNLQRAGDGG